MIARPIVVAAERNELCGKEQIGKEALLLESQRERSNIMQEGSVCSALVGAGLERGDTHCAFLVL